MAPMVVFNLIWFHLFVAPLLALSSMILMPLQLAVMGVIEKRNILTAASREEPSIALIVEAWKSVAMAIGLVLVLMAVNFQLQYHAANQLFPK